MTDEQFRKIERLLTRIEAVQTLAVSYYLSSQGVSKKDSILLFETALKEKT